LAIKKRGYSFEDKDDHALVLQDLALTQFGQLTNAADVVFGKAVSLRHPQTRVRGVTYETDRATDFTDEQLFEGPALTLLDDVMTFLKRHVSIANELKADQIARETKPSYPFFSLREGLVNALAHRDYSSFSGCVSVTVYPERIEIWNTGRLPKGVTPRKLQQAEHESVLVNPDISHVFYLNELMERVGRGTYKIVQECKEFQMRGPKWQNTATGVRLTFYAATSPVNAAAELNDRQLALLKSLKEGGQVQIKQFAAKFATDVSERQARRDLAELATLGSLKRVGSGPSTAFKRTEKKLN
jgi:ATP-dependent DNA helicase RecG